ncbi:polysaccharide deacetylase family protein [Paenibacillus sp. GXUN7292]|uniref:polysaccharide deacetylase family protein n=1 Tax=Paenibacillus sp. GXUN7292 TaxID=3422499 RepID=UPI003D7CA27E
MLWMRKGAAIACTILALLIFVRLNSDVAFFIKSLKSSKESQLVWSSKRTEAEEQLYERIVAEAKNQYIAPINARIDRVWHAIPGYNGLEVDVEKTFQAARLNPNSDIIPFHYAEVEPDIKLEQLGAHPVYRGNPNKKMISFMINVAWGNEYIEAILKTLRDENVKATFFLDGSWLKKNPDIAKQIQAEGHEMSNHAYSHPDMKLLGRAEQQSQIQRTEQLLESVLQVKNRLFAPPSGSYNKATVQIAREQGLQTVLWTIDTVDWRKPPASSIVTKITNHLEPGALILMHPTASSRDALPGMIKAAKKRGYAIGTVSQTLSSKRIDAGAVEGK